MTASTIEVAELGESIQMGGKMQESRAEALLEGRIENLSELHVDKDRWRLSTSLHGLFYYSYFITIKDRAHESMLESSASKQSKDEFA